MLKSILGILLAVAVVGLVSLGIANYYHKNKLESNDFTNTNEKSNKDNIVDKNSSKKDKKDNSNKVSETKEEGVIEASSVEVESTSSFKNNYVVVLGSISILLGLGSIVYNKN